MKKILVIALPLFVLGLFFVPEINTLEAQGIAQLAQCSGNDCTSCNLVHLGNGLIQWLIGILFIIFAILTVVAGVRLVISGGSTQALDSAKELFKNAFIGFVIVLASWLIVDTIMRVLLGNGGRLGSSGEVSGWLFWSEVECQTVRDATRAEIRTVEFDLPEALIDQGGGTAGQITISTPSGPQVVNVSPCDTSTLTTINFLGGSVTLNRQFAASAARIDAAWRARGGNSFYRVTSIGGYACRNVAGTNRRSNHAYGLAIDINPAQNPHTFPGDSNYGQTNMPPAFRQIFLNEGWGWGGNWNSSKDTMHFSKATGEGGNMRGN